jgi:hypothetical protein
MSRSFSEGQKVYVRTPGPDGYDQLAKGTVTGFDGVLLLVRLEGEEVTRLYSSEHRSPTTKPDGPGFVHPTPRPHESPVTMRLASGLSRR